jgi:hypothetical protein
MFSLSAAALMQRVITVGAAGDHSRDIPVNLTGNALAADVGGSS